MKLKPLWMALGFTSVTFLFLIILILVLPSESEKVLDAEMRSIIETRYLIDRANLEFERSEKILQVYKEAAAKIEEEIKRRQRQKELEMENSRKL